MPAHDTKTFELTAAVSGLLITAGLVSLIAYCMQLVLRLLSWGVLAVDLAQLAYLFAFFVLSLFLTVGTRQRPDYAPFLLYNLALHGGFVLAGVLLFRPERPAVWLMSPLSCWTLMFTARYGFARLKRRALGVLFGPEVHGSDPLVERCFFVQSPVYHAVVVGLALGTLYGALLPRPGSSLEWRAVAGVFAALALAELRGLIAGSRMLTGELATGRAEPQTVFQVNTAFDRCQLHVLAPQGSGLLRIATAVRRVYLMGQLERLMVVSLCTLAVWRLELRDLPGVLIGAVLLATGLLTTLLPYVLGQRACRARQRALARDPRLTAEATLPGLGSWVLSAGALLLGALAFLCLDPLLAQAYR